MNISSKRINFLADRFNARSYLEIGVHKGDTFLNVAIKNRFAVDPAFKFEYRHLESDSCHFFPVASDLFFESLKSGSFNNIPPDIKFDLIFIDGLHIYENAFRDFINSILFSHTNTIWIIDDTIPSDPYSSIPDNALSYQYRARAGLIDRPWHGDVYKCIFALHDFYMDFSYATIYDSGNPQTVVWKTNWNAQRKRIFDNINSIGQLNYFDILRYTNVFNLSTDKNLPSLIGERFDTSAISRDEALRILIKPLRVSARS